MLLEAYRIRGQVRPRVPRAARYAGFRWHTPCSENSLEVALTFGILVASCALLRLAVGSFLNVVIYRVPRSESIVAPRSACPDCETPIAGRDNIPVISWLVLRGRCRSCGLRISPRYPIVEAATAALFVGVAIRFGAHPALPAYLAMVAGLVALA